MAITPRTSTVVAGRTIPLNGYSVLTAEDAERAKAEVLGVAQYALTLTAGGRIENGSNGGNVGGGSNRY